MAVKDGFSLKMLPRLLPTSKKDLQPKP